MAEYRSDFLNELEGETASLTDEEFTTLESMIRERRGRAAAHVVVTPIHAAQPCNPRSRSLQIKYRSMYMFLYGEKQRGQDGPRARAARITIGWCGV